MSKVTPTPTRDRVFSGLKTHLFRLRRFKHRLDLSFNKPNLQLVLEPDLNSYSIVDNGSFETRSKGTARLLRLALQGVDLTQYEPRTFDFWADDFPPLLLDPRHVHLSYCCASRLALLVHAVPDWFFWAWPEVGADDYEVLRLQIEEASRLPPAHPTLFWIGNPQVHPTRKRLFDMAGAHHLFDFRSVTWQKDAASQGKQTSPTFISLSAHCQYKYLLDVEGRGFSARLKVLLFSGRPVFVQQRKWVEYFWRDLLPLYHYIPVREDLTDLPARLDWAEANPAACQEIAANALRYARENLTRGAAVAALRRIILDLARRRGQGA